MKFSAAAVVLSGAVLSQAAVLDDPLRGLRPNGTVPLVPTQPLDRIMKHMPMTPEQLKNLLANSKPKPEMVHPTLELELNKTFVRKPTPKGAPTRPEGAGPAKAEFKLLAAAKTSTALPAPTETDTAHLQVWPCSNPRVRVEWRNLNDQQRDNFIGAVRCLMNRPSSDPNLFQGSRNRFEDLAALHNQVTPEVHDHAVFLVWHRYFVGVFESLLRDECGYQDPLPWWNEALDAGNFKGAPMLTPRWFGSLSDSETCVDQAGWGAYQPTVGWSSCLSRHADEGSSANCNQDEVSKCVYQSNNYDDYRWCSEGWVHAMGHFGIGSRMSDKYTSPEDPIFYLHHAFIDRNFKVWQNQQWWTRVYEYGGDIWSGGPASPSDVMSSWGIRPQITVADALDTEAAYFCYVYDDQMGS